jgi:putative two-component system response regulator
LKVEQLNRALVAALETSAYESNPDTYFHVQRVACYAALLGKTMGLPDESVRKLYAYAPLHDIGKAGIPHDILSKPAPLTSEEFMIVKRHVQIGIRLLKSIDIDPFVLDLILYHHERWDGTGYLAEVSGEGIPLSARITAVADVLDAMLCKRPYKDAMPFAEVAAYIEGQAGAQFDPAVVRAFKAERDTFELISSGTASGLCRQIADSLA